MNREISLLLSLVAVAVVAAGCYGVDYPEQYACTADQPLCPPGQVCNGSTCVPTGSRLDLGLDGPLEDGPVKDGLTADLGDGPRPDVSTVDKGALDKAPPLDKSVPTPDLPVGSSVSTLAGSGIAGFQNGAPKGARFNQPTGLTLNKGQVFVADSANHSIRKIATDGTVSTFAGQATAGNVNGVGTKAKFNLPYRITTTASGHLLVADRGNFQIRRIDAAAKVSLFAGSTMGLKEGAIAVAQFALPVGVAADGTKVYVADANNHRIRRIDPQVSTHTGTSAGFQDGSLSQARFNGPYDVAVDSGGKIFVVDRKNHRIRLINGTTVSTLAGTGTAGVQNGVAAQARFNDPIGIALGSKGVYVADRGNHCIRLIKGGFVSTVAGKCGTAGFKDAPLTGALFDHPNDVAVDSAGKIYVADRDNHRIRLITP